MPLIRATQLGQAIDFEGLYLKDEGLNPTALTVLTSQP